MFTLQQLQDDLSLIDRMSMRDIDLFLTAHHRKRLPSHIRPLLQQRVKVIKHNNTVLLRAHAIGERIDAIWDRVEHLWAKPNTSSLKRYHARSMGTDIHDFPSIWSGMESEQNISLRSQMRSMGKKYVGCKEHYYPRQWAGAKIIEQMLSDGPTFTKYHLANMICKYSHVHIVTQKENQQLLPFQTTDAFELPTIAYEKAGIVLIRTAPLQIHCGWDTLLQQLYTMCVEDGKRS